MKTGVIALVVVAVLALLVGGAYVSARNQMVTKNEAVKSAWSEVDVVLQRRADLIPNLVETVKGFAAQEQTVFHDIASGRLLLIVENYPQLKSNENFLRLQDELAGTENRIAVERKRYNDTLQDYNTYVGLFPNDIFARWAGFQRNNDYFTATAASREAPKVQFPTPNR
jgi:LemA protein